MFSFLKNNFDIARDAEVTIEANPESLSEEKAAALLGSGVNRLSIGVQSWNEKYLRYLGRKHMPETAEHAIKVARKQGFANVNIDIMFGFPGQTVDELKCDIDATIERRVEHISVYQLTIEPNSRFNVEKVVLDGDDHSALLYGTLIDELSKSGLCQYEVSNFAREGKRSLHNLNYWEGGNYIGLGVGAHSHVDGQRYWNEPRLLKYLELSRSGKSVTVGEEHLSPEQRLTEALLFGLRKTAGVKVGELEMRYGRRLDKDSMDKITSLMDIGLLSYEGECLKATRKGLFLLDEIAARLI
jgi:oxygen-independent coproporphyrinogen-3 oxidase